MAASRGTAAQAAPTSLLQSVSAAIADYSQLFKIRVTAMILLTAWCGAYLAAKIYTDAIFSWNLLSALLAIAFVAAGTAAMNEVIERNTDAKMLRTRRRPLVTGRIAVSYACATSLTMIVGSVIYLALVTNWLTAALTLLTSGLYLGAYTPLKRVSPLCTTIGAVPGAMPALLGWTAVRGQLDFGAFILFAIVFFWQFPHFHAIALLHRDDYARADIRMLPVVHSDGHSTVRSIIIHSFLLVPISFLPVWFGLSGFAYLVVAFVLGIALFSLGALLWYEHSFGTTQNTRRRARQVLLASVIYIPALFTAMLLNAR